MSKNRQGKVPGMRSNGATNPAIPPDLEWDEDNPPEIFPCSQHTEHAPGCPGTEDAIQLDSESQVRLINEARAWARVGMNFTGVPAGFPATGIPVELVDLLVWAQVVREIVIELAGITEFEYEEKFREAKFELLNSIRVRHEDEVKKRRVADQLGIVQRPPLLGPDGQPIS